VRYIIVKNADKTGSRNIYVQSWQKQSVYKQCLTKAGISCAGPVILQERSQYRRTNRQGQSRGSSV